jgi:hypothetical protein
MKPKSPVMVVHRITRPAKFGKLPGLTIVLTTAGKLGQMDSFFIRNNLIKGRGDRVGEAGTGYQHAGARWSSFRLPSAEARFPFRILPCRPVEFAQQK